MKDSPEDTTPSNQSKIALSSNGGTNNAWDINALSARESTSTLWRGLILSHLSFMIIRRVKLGEEERIEVEPESKTKNGFIFRSSKFPGVGLGISFLDEEGNYLQITESKTHKEGVFTYFVEYDN